MVSCPVEDLLQLQGQNVPNESEWGSRVGLGDCSQLDVLAFPRSLRFEFDESLSLIQTPPYSTVLYTRGERPGGLQSSLPHCLLQESQHRC